MIRLAECTYPEAARVARDERAVVIVPLGAIEQHGPHLPLLVDWLGAEELARHVTPHLARAGYRVVLAPSLPYGASPLAETWAARNGVDLARSYFYSDSYNDLPMLERVGTAIAVNPDARLARLARRRGWHTTRWC